jgi:hypothetical protein
VDLVGNKAFATSSGVTVDISGPTIGTISDGGKTDLDWTNDPTSLTAYWIGFKDENSGIKFYEYAIGSSIGAMDVISWTNVGLDTSVTHSGLSLSEGKTYYFFVRATDQLGNVSSVATSDGIAVDVSPPTITEINPVQNSVLSITDTANVTVQFSEEVSDFEVKITSHYGSIQFGTDHSEDGLNISIYPPRTSLDSLTLQLKNLTDRSGLVAEDTSYNFRVALIADYNNDYKVDIQDLSSFISLWPNFDLGPVIGEIPYFTPQLDGIANLRDVGVFTRMWHWSYANNGASSKVFGSIGDPIKIDQSSDRIIIPMPDNAVAGEVLFQYQKTDVDLGLSDEITENRMVISYRDSLQGLLAVNFGYMKEMQNKNLSFALQVKGRNNSDLTISYVYYDENSIVVNMGTQDFNLKAIPLEFALHDNYPNPFNPITTINYDLPQQAHVNLMIYDILGREVVKLVSSEIPAGYQSVIWNTRNNIGAPVSAGIYFYQIQTKDFIKTKKMVLLK